MAGGWCMAEIITFISFAQDFKCFLPLHPALGRIEQLKFKAISLRGIATCTHDNK